MHKRVSCVLKEKGRDKETVLYHVPVKHKIILKTL